MLPCLQLRLTNVTNCPKPLSPSSVDAHRVLIVLPANRKSIDAVDENGYFCYSFTDTFINRCKQQQTCCPVFLMSATSRKPVIEVCGLVLSVNWEISVYIT